MDYLKLFQNHEEYEAFVSGGTMMKPNVSHCVNENEVHYNPYVHDYSQDYLTFVALEDGTFTFTPNNDNVISYSMDSGKTWTELAANTNTPTVAKDKKILWKGEMTPSRRDNIGMFTSTGRFDAEGNVMSLLFGDNFKGQTDLTGYDGVFAGLFRGLYVNTKNLSLPATTLAFACYSGMFQGCTSLTTAPELPATTLADYCYADMFAGCTSLTTAPALPATTLAFYCYGYMFQDCTGLVNIPSVGTSETILAESCCQEMFSNCTSLVTAPELPATTLADSCYQRMFKDCTSLTTAPELPATTLADSCYVNMFQGCTSLTTAPSVLPATTLTEFCYSSMFDGCASLTTAPTLPATTLARSCYNTMFYNCTSLTTAPSVLPATTLADYCYGYMFYGCTSLVNAPELPATTLVETCYDCMFFGCTNLNYIKAMFTTTPSMDYTQNWMYGVAASGTFVKNAAATWDVSGQYGIPNGWTVETATA